MSSEYRKYIAPLTDPTKVGDHQILQLMRDQIHGSNNRENAIRHMTAALEEFLGDQREALLKEGMAVVDQVHPEGPPPIRFRLQEAYKLPDGTFYEPHWDEWMNIEFQSAIPDEELTDALKQVGEWYEVADGELEVGSFAWHIGTADVDAGVADIVEVPTMNTLRIAFKGGASFEVPRECCKPMPLCRRVAATMAGATKIVRLVSHEATEKTWFVEVPVTVEPDEVPRYWMEQEFAIDTPAVHEEVIESEEWLKVLEEYTPGSRPFQSVVKLDPDYTGWKIPSERDPAEVERDLLKDRMKAAEAEIWKHYESVRCEIALSTRTGNTPTRRAHR